MLKSRAFVSVDVTNSGADRVGGTRAVMWPTLINALTEAMEFDGEDWDGMLSKADAEALSHVVAGHIPLLVMADRKADILQVMALKQRFAKLNVVLVNGVEAWRVAEQLAQANIPVIINPEYNLPGGFDRLGATLANAGRLAQAGVDVAIGMETHNIRLATQHAGNAVANGMPYQDGLAALTSNVAKIYGMDKQVGSIKAGMSADVVIWSGDPLEVTEAAEQVFIKGQAIEMRSRQTELRDRYLDLEQARPMSYVRP